MMFPDCPGSGQFIREREWSCPKHEVPMRHECDCGHCKREWDCRSCARAEWVDLTNGDGTPKMRELSIIEVTLRDDFRNLMRPLNIDWIEDQLLPKVQATDDRSSGRLRG